MATRASIQGLMADLQRRQQAELRQRQNADNILGPDVVGARNGISTARLLQTSLGGVRRAITAEDLKLFKARTRELGAKVRQGVTAQDLIDMSAPADRERSRQQMRSATPTRMINGEVLFAVNAGPESKVLRHVVIVQFPGYSSAVAHPGTPAQAAKLLSEMPLRVDCTCETHRFRFRFILTAMGAAAGRQETGTPKLTNPNLIGAGCKHVLRVMQELSSPSVRLKLADMIRASRDSLSRPGARTRVVTTSAAEADRIARAKPKAIKTTGERDAMRLRAAVTKALPARSGDGVAAELSAALAQLSKRKDVTAATLLAAVKLVQQQGARP